MGQPEGKKPLGISSCKWKNNIKLNLRGLGWGSTAWIDMAFVNMVINFRVP
jgi:hypothetical protein